MTARIFSFDAALAGDRRLHGLRIGVHGEEGRAESARRSRRPSATVLPMSCSLRSRNTCLPAAIKLLRERQPAGKGELIADLVERHRVAEPRHHRLARPRPRAGRARRSAGRARSCAPSCLTSSVAPSRPAAQLRAQQIGACRCRSRLSMSSKAWSACATATCSGITSAPQPSSRICRSAISARTPPSVPGEADADREDAALEGGIGRIAALAHARHPVDGVLQQRRHRGVVFRAGDEHAVMRHDHLLELDAHWPAGRTCASRSAS